MGGDWGRVFSGGEGRVKIKSSCDYKHDKMTRGDVSVM